MCVHRIGAWRSSGLPAQGRQPAAMLLVMSPSIIAAVWLGVVECVQRGYLPPLPASGCDEFMIYLLHLGSYHIDLRHSDGEDDQLMLLILSALLSLGFISVVPNDEPTAERY